MTTHQLVYQTFVLYICLKASILLPLAWFTFLVRRAERRTELLASATIEPEVMMTPAAEPVAVNTPAFRLPEAA